MTRCRNSGVMKTRILTQLVTAAAGIALPLSVFAQDFGNQTNSGNIGTDAFPSGPAHESAGGSGSYSSGGTFSGSNGQPEQSQSGTFRDGIMVKDGTAYIVHRLQNEMSLPDGSKVQPNGTIRESDGSMRNIESGKVLTMDGRMMDSPFGSGEGASKPGSMSPGMFNSPNTPGSSTGIGGESIPSDSLNTAPESRVPTTSTPSEGLGGPTSTSGQSSTESSSSPSPADQSDGSGLAPGSVSTDPTQDYTD
jgi:hypothetical protein